MMTPEQRQQYNADYYAKNKDRWPKVYKPVQKRKAIPKRFNSKEYNKTYYHLHKEERNTPERREYQRLYYAEHKDELKARRILG
jgi:hypothetical protein